jgi:hypothetical protein
VWDDTGNRRFETGIDHGILYPLNPSTSAYDMGFAWNGLTGVKEKPAGAAVTKSYADNMAYLSLLSAETFDLEIDAYTYPPEFGACDGTVAPSSGVVVGQQARQTFGLAYRTKIGNDVEADLGYLLHLVYGCLAAPSEKDYATINDSPAAVTFSWSVSTVPVPVSGLKPTSLITIDSTKVSSTNLDALNQILQGTVGVDPELPLPDAIIALFAATVTVVTTIEPTFNPTGHVLTIPTVTGVTYHMDGAVIASGDHAITEDKVVTATADDSYVFSPLSVDAWHIVYS